jgi:hypothetical protein
LSLHRRVPSRHPLDPGRRIRLHQDPELPRKQSTERRDRLRVIPTGIASEIPADSICMARNASRVGGGPASRAGAVVAPSRSAGWPGPDPGGAGAWPSAEMSLAEAGHHRPAHPHPGPLHRTRRRARHHHRPASRARQERAPRAP